MRAIIWAAPVLLLLVACKTAPQPVVPWRPEASLLVLCDPTGPLLGGGSGKDIVLWGVVMRHKYETCAARHKRLVEAVPK